MLRSDCHPLMFMHLMTLHVHIDNVIYYQLQRGNSSFSASKLLTVQEIRSSIENFFLAQVYL